MYLFERLIWMHRTQDQADRNKWDETERKEFGPSQVRIDPDAKEWGVEDCLQIEPTDAGSIYAINDRFLDVRASFQEEKRGLITLLFFAFVYVLGYMGLYRLSLEPLFWMISANTTPWDRPVEAGDWVGVVLGFILLAAAALVVLRYGWRWLRVEIFTQRHLVARFNRVTRQVYLNRPPYAGGVVVLPWEAAVAAIDPSEPDHHGMSGFVAVVFSKERSGSDYGDTVFLGRPMRGSREIEGLWEYIRRYMEDGPNSVPKPGRLLPLSPWPLEPVRATFRFMSPMWRSSSRPVALLTGLLLVPLLALHALSHWISLLLCWAPQWPEIIRDAGLPGKAVPKVTTLSDFGPELAERIFYNDKRDEAKARPPRRKKKVGSRESA
ncbi:hypothetical protein H0E84_17325 [Luteimonas sp. SJ-92]|uniref:DUF6708 domain-containing protein n=1 Tax=Luteimonas salinisoli TaxID=2752307 RepID=A0A853JFJ7_9GAMM|nr:DUF6708 domain-containing protein [Luteimonas salinisoli]NZA28143.1 hypothetical protein [Luteimonas salinisoli]